MLVLERTARAAFGPGATVFPGGAVDPADSSPRTTARVTGLSDAEASARQGLEHGGLAFRVAAVRESFEEAGLLLAVDATGRRPPDHGPALARAREELNAGSIELADVLEAHDLLLDARALRLFSHWLTPLGAPRRYNTWFFVAPAPDGEDGAHDDNELVASEWVRPTDALAAFADGDIDLIFPTEMSLRVLARYDRAKDLLDDLDAAHRLAPDDLRVVSDGTGERVALRGDAGRATGGWTNPLPDISFRVERELAGRAPAGVHEELGA